MKKDLTKFSDLSLSDVSHLIENAFLFKEASDRGVRKDNRLDGKAVALVFEKPSLRTKVAFEVATMYLGGTPIFLSSEQILSSGQNQRGRESIPDIARNLERFVDIIIARVYSHSVIQELAKTVSKPVVNALCDLHHPTQALADLMAIEWHFGKKETIDKKNFKVCFIGDGNNVANSFLEMCATVGFNATIASPKGYELSLDAQKNLQSICEQSGAYIFYGNDPKAAIKDADVVYTDTFVSMGQESDTIKRIKEFSKFQVNQDLFSYAKKTAKFMHCLPAHRGEEVTDDIIDSEHSIVFDQAECRLHIAKALLSYLV